MSKLIHNASFPDQLQCLDYINSYNADTLLCLNSACKYWSEGPTRDFYCHSLHERFMTTILCCQKKLVCRFACKCLWTRCLY